MKLWARFSLMIRVMLGASLALVFASVLLLVVSTDQEAKSARIQIDEHLAGEIDTLLPAIAEWAVIGDYASIEQMFRQRVQRADIRSISWLTDKGRAIEAIDKDVDRRAPLWFVDWVGVLSPGMSRTLSIGGRNYGQVTVDMTATPAQNRLWRSFRGHLAILALALALNVTGIYLILRNGLRPLSILTKGADELARGDFTHRIALQGSPELAGLIMAFNRMADGIATAQGALRDEVERVSVTLSSIGDAVIATDIHGRVEFMNPVAEAKTGWTVAEAAGRHIRQVFAIINETTRKEADCPVLRAIREGAIVGLANHTLLISRDGTERPVADSAAPIRHTDGAIHGAVLVFRDQGPEREAARILRESEAAYRGLFDGVSEAIYVQDAQGRFLDVNQAAERMYGLPRDAFIGKTPEFIAAPGRNDLEALSGIVARAMAGEPQCFEFWGRRANGEVFPKEVRLVRGQYRGLNVVIASADDITGRKRAEKVLRESEARLRFIIESAAEGFWMIDSSRKTIEVNSVLCDLLGHGREEVLGHQPTEFVDADNARIFREQMAQIGDTRHRYYEIELRRKDGRRIPAYFQASTHFDAEGKPSGSFAFVTDLSARKAMERELEQHRQHLEELVAERTAELTVARNEAERLARAKSEFLANMSHELRTPLNGVLGMARIGARDSAGRSSHETFVRIQDSGAHLLGVINDILDFSKIDAGKLAVERRPFALAGAIDNAVAFVGGTAQQKGLAFETAVAADLPEWVAGDAQRLQQILVNLLSNAVKFTERGEVRLRVAGEGGDIYFKVVDTGIGMTAEQAARLFQPFEQADSSTTRRYGGTGLGLAISQNLARLMGGEISADCAPGVGCSFTLRLPLPVAAPDLAARTGPVGGERRLAGLRLLAAEDVEVNRLILEDLLVHEGAHVIFAGDGQQALDRLEEAGVSAFDAVLMDVQMPVMNGLEATRRLREIAPALPVIGLTAHALAEERDNCLAAGMAEHVTKPIDPDLLVAAILRHARPDGPIPSPAFPFKGKAGEGMGPASSAPVAAVPPAPTVAASLVEWQALLAQYSGREAFVAKLATIALDSQRETPAKLRTAAEQGDLKDVAFIAHSLKGVGGNLMAPAVRDLAARTEIAARQDDPSVAELAAELATQVDDLLAELAAHVREGDGTGST